MLNKSLCDVDVFEPELAVFRDDGLAVLAKTRPRDRYARGIFRPYPRVKPAYLAIHDSAVAAIPQVDSCGTERLVGHAVGRLISRGGFRSSKRIEAAHPSFCLQSAYRAQGRFSIEGQQLFEQRPALALELIDRHLTEDRAVIDEFRYSIR